MSDYLPEHPRFKKKEPRLYERRGFASTLEEKIEECRKAGMVDIKRDDEAGTASVNDLDGTKVIRALAKGTGIWLIMYNPKYFPKPK